MGKIKIRFVDIIYWLAIIGADIFVYIILGDFRHFARLQSVCGNYTDNTYDIRKD